VLLKVIQRFLVTVTAV